MEFIHVNFESSYFEECFIKNCVFENYDFISCNLSDWDVEKTTFNKCRFVRSCLNNSVFDSCNFRSPIFEGVEDGLFIALVLIDSKFSNSKKSIEFEGEVSFNEIFDQIHELSLE